MKNLLCIKSLSSVLFLSLAILLISDVEVFASANTSGYDTTRIYHAMAKARRGEPVTIGVIGGSITAGSLASSEATRWANLMTDWWETTFPTSTVTLVNAGIGGTGSDIGTHRLYRDLLNYDPDFIVVEFSVNDDQGAYAEKMMEGLIRQILEADSLPGVMMLLLKQRDGTSAQAAHKLVGNHYNVPMVSFADMIDTAVANDGYDLADIYGDAAEPNYGLHENDLGMAYIAEFLADELNLIYSNLPDDANIPAVDTDLPAPLITATYAHAYIYNTSTLIPSTNNGWSVTGGKWTANTPDSQIDFIVDGNAISFIYTRHNTPNRGQIEAWVDDGPHQTFDAYWTETWGPGQRFALIQEGLADGEHILHMKVLNSNSTGSDGHYFEIINVCKAGNWLTASPIANAGDNIKILIGAVVNLDGTASFDPDNDTIRSYEWSVVSAPGGSVAAILTPSDSITEITPDIEGKYRIGLTVNDGLANSVTGIKIINAKLTNNVPVANAGVDRNIPTRVWCYPSGSNSSDADGDSLSYLWRKVSEPEESNTRLYNSDTRTLKFMPTAEGDYTMGLVVNDSLNLSTEDLLVLTAIDGYSGLQEMNVRGLNLISYPNPAEQYIHVQYTVPEMENISLSLTSLDGKKKVDLINVLTEPGDYSLIIDINDLRLNKGMYLLQMISNQGMVYNKITIF
jgi:lysophospholipase L1-like esterase